jgi:hypothetical protein
MHDADHSRAEQTDSHESPLTIVVTIIDPGGYWPGKYCTAIRKIQAMLTQVAASLTLVPLEYQHSGIAHCSYIL